MTDRLAGLRIFQRIAHCGSFSRAGRELGLSQPSVSRIMADLERDVGVALITRSTRGVSLTERGIDYLARVEPILGALDEADHAARGTGELRGRLRVGLSSSFAAREVIPRLPGFIAKHPALLIDLVVNDSRQNLVTEGLQVVFRLGELPDSSDLARKLSETPRLLVAAPDYLRRSRRLAAPSDLAAHAVIVGPGAAGTLEFRKGERRVQVRVNGRLTVAVNEAATAAAVAGLGVTVTAIWGCRAELERGDLLRVLPKWKLPSVQLHALYPPGQSPSAAARALVDYLAPSLTARDS
jgi:DNA-binding transcriptional LysR family regulator